MLKWMVIRTDDDGHFALRRDWSLLERFCWRMLGAKFQDAPPDEMLLKFDVRDARLPDEDF